MVKVDGITLPSAAYRVDDNRKLMRVDGGMWPVCNDLNLADTQIGTWSVTASYGEDVPMIGRLAVGELMCQMIKACNGEDCLLPANVTQLVRQGVTISYVDPNDIFNNLYHGRLFLNSYNPNKLRGRPHVYDIDGDSWRRAGT